jgi:hypothetical protein
VELTPAHAQIWRELKKGQPFEKLPRKFDPTYTRSKNIPTLHYGITVPDTNIREYGTEHGMLDRIIKELKGEYQFTHESIVNSILTVYAVRHLEDICNARLFHILAFDFDTIGAITLVKLFDNKSMWRELEDEEEAEVVEILRRELKLPPIAHPMWYWQANEAWDKESVDAFPEI